MRKLIEGITDSMIDSEGEAHMIKRIRGVPHEGEEPSTRSLSVTSTSLTAVDMASMDMTPEDTVLPIPANKALKVLANIIENTAVTRQYVTVKKERKDKNLADPNSCKTTKKKLILSPPPAALFFLCFLVF